MAWLQSGPALRHGATARNPAAPAAQRAAPDADRVRHAITRCPELDCVSYLLTPAERAAAELRAAEIGAGADEVLIAAGRLNAEDYARSLAHWLRVPFESFEETTRSQCPLDDESFLRSAAEGRLALRRGERDILVVAAQGHTARQLVQLLRSEPELAECVSVTTPARLRAFIAARGAYALGQAAAYSLKASLPRFSAANRGSPLRAWAAASILALGFWLAPQFVWTGIDVALALIFLGWTGLRILGALTPSSRPPGDGIASDADLPDYTIIVALYREAPALRGLIDALLALDYPREKLEIKFAIEVDDFETRGALSQIELPPHFDVILAPPEGPRTKPKALNAALPFARGDLIAVYDAEDRPEPDQLRRACEAFAGADEHLGCVQARLTIDNTSDSALTRLFTAEYAGLFDAFLPGLAAWRLPFPLGGSSNHFRASALRATGGWDPFNVTEDADLGMRLSRRGYRTAVISSTTYEEAPAQFMPWLRQRTRWFKGWIQTWNVHMRHPLALLRDLGVAGFAVFQLVVGGTVLAALVYAAFFAALIWEFASRGTGIFSETSALLAGLHYTTLIVGYTGFGVLGIVGLWRRNLLHCVPWLALIPLYWVLLSIAAWRALFQLMRDPYRGEKTQHGLARTSRLAASAGTAGDQK